MKKIIFFLFFILLLSSVTSFKNLGIFSYVGENYTIAPSQSEDLGCNVYPIPHRYFNNSFNIVGFDSTFTDIEDISWFVWGCTTYSPDDRELPIHYGISPITDDFNYHGQHTEFAFRSLDIKGGSQTHNYTVSFLLTDTYLFTPQNISVNISRLSSIVGNLQQWVTLLYDNGLSVVEQNNINFAHSSGSYTNITPSVFLNDTFEFNRIDFTISITDQDDYHYTDILFENELTNLDENSMPIFNLTTNNTCLTKNETSTEFPLKIESYDSESDTIYYSIESLTEKNEFATIEYNTKGYFDNYKNLEFLNNFYLTNSCGIETGDLNTSKNNLVEYENSNGIEKYMLALSTTCSGESSFNYILPYSLDQLFYFTEIYGLTSNGETLNITLFDSLYNEMSRFQFKTNTTHLIISDWNSSAFNEKTSGTIPTFLQFSLNYYSDNNQSYLFIFEGFNEIVNISTNGNDNIKFIEISNSNGVIYQDGFQYSGFHYQPIFSTTKPNNVTVYSTGVYNTKICVTDEPHLTLNYSCKTAYTTVPDCDSYFKPINTGPAQDNLNPLEWFKKILGTPFKSYLDNSSIQGISNYERGKYVLWYIFMFLLVSVMATEYFLTKHVDLVIPLVSSSFLCFVIAYMLDYSQHMITFLIFIAFAVAMPVAKAFMGGGSGIGN